jgi:hypothetical protein
VVILLMVLLWKVASSFIGFMWWLTKGDKLQVCHRREKKVENLSPLQRELSFLYKQWRVVVMKVWRCWNNRNSRGLLYFI